MRMAAGGSLPNSTVERPAGSHSLAAAAHRARWAPEHLRMRNFLRPDGESKRLPCSGGWVRLLND